MKDDLPDSKHVALVEEVENTRVVISLDAFVQFDLWMDEQLSLLESRWGFLSTPRSSQPSRRSVPPRKPR